LNQWLDPQRELKRLERQLEHLAAVFNRCEPGWFIDAEWVDASTSRNVDLAHPPLPNRLVETRKFTRGKFVTVQEGKTWRDPHVVISMERTDELSEITVVPLVCIKALEFAESKTSLETVKQLNPVGVNEVRRANAVQRGKRLLRFRDGSVKEIGLTMKKVMENV